MMTAGWIVVETAFAFFVGAAGFFSEARTGFGVGTGSAFFASSNVSWTAWGFTVGFLCV